MKGKLLLSLKEYPRQNLRNAFYKWYITTSQTGQGLLQKMVTRLVLQTNVNKTTAFYRMFQKVKKTENYVSCKSKRLALVLYLYSRIYLQREKQEFFEKFKIFASKERDLGRVGKNLIESSRAKMKEVLLRWRRIGGQNEKRQELVKMIQRMIFRTKVGKIYESVQKWKSLPQRKDLKRAEKGHKFINGLKSYYQRTLKKTMDAFKNEL